MYSTQIFLGGKKTVIHQNVFFFSCSKGCSTFVVTRLTYYRGNYVSICLTVYTVCNYYLKTITVIHQSFFLSCSKGFSTFLVAELTYRWKFANISLTICTVHNLLKENWNSPISFYIFKDCSTLLVARLTYCRWKSANISLTVRTIHQYFYLKKILKFNKSFELD